MKFLLLTGVLCLWLAPAWCASLGVVQTEGGKVKGKNQNMGLLHSVDVFKGIPFADVPGRWELPKRHPGWDGVLQAIKYQKRCLQVTLLQLSSQGSEDCLYLNIHVPQGGLSLSKALPVMVYIFGGAFLLGASNDVPFLGNSLYDGNEMADRGGVIVVSVNYRVGSLGFLSTGDARMPGNYGLWDQHAAISWVKRNIEAFGGNPDNITIFGQSAGAASVNYQMLSPYSKGLFRRAISQCGVALSPWAIQLDPMATTKKVARKVGCRTTNEEEMLLCLKITDPVGITMAAKLNLLLMLGPSPVMNLLEFTPVVDGDFIPDHPSRLFNNTADFDYLAGVNSMDGHLFAGVDVPSINQRRKETTAAQVKKLISGLTQQKGAEAIQSVYSMYSANWGSVPQQDMVKKTVTDIETDYLFLVPTQVALQLHAQHARGARTYSYLFDMKTRIPGLPSWVGAMHAEDVQYLFGKPFDKPLIYFPRHRDLSGYMIAYWTNFAKTGDPSRGSRVPTVWPAFTPSRHPYLVINSDITKSSVRFDLREEYVRYWTDTYNNMPSVNSDQ
ncbi:bile salt-activated lipase-like [Gadus macrocephalus]|uniref:bile salt-activated lipase-like n=1 Tax=Gadus macrocephalus TaxID=80720 RepID=UPI0028CB8550|nr:bile salt-activated lipase-like [Gadus macrocephalus]